MQGIWSPSRENEFPASSAGGRLACLSGYGIQRGPTCAVKNEGS
jgi:hypothetical protein